MFIKNRYENCTYIDGNLEIVFLNNRSVDYDLSFLESIREVTGYILIVSVFASYIPLTNLQIIRGNDLFPHKDDFYSLFVADNYEASSKHIGLKELRFKSLAGEFCSSFFCRWGLYRVFESDFWRQFMSSNKNRD